MKYPLLLLSLIFSTSYAFAQGGKKPTIAILPFQNGPNVRVADASALAQKVESAFINSKRFTVIERSNFEQIYKELEAQKAEVYLNSTNLAKQGELIGASQLVVGNVSSVSAEGTSFNIKIVDISTGETIGSKTISDFNKRNNASKLGAAAKLLTGGKNNAIVDQASNSVGGVLLNIDKEIQEFINETFALTYEIVEITKSKGNEATELMIVGGTLNGLSSGDPLEIIREHTINAGGKQLKQKTTIGKIKVDKVQGDVTLCKVSSGGKEIKELFSPSNNVYATTITKK